ncbi:MAG: hypothetical protein IKQ60_06570 [Candidatus Methanomethylophilaceae archaeon]|nr:hypothetical protein [Candidatus Methanomethylophilaceae archaeon]
MSPNGEDGQPVAPYPVVKIGKMVGDCSRMDDIGDRQRIIVSPMLRPFMALETLSAPRKPRRPSCRRNRQVRI